MWLSRVGRQGVDDGSRPRCAAAFEAVPAPGALRYGGGVLAHQDQMGEHGTIDSIVSYDHNGDGCTPIGYGEHSGGDPAGEGLLRFDAGRLFERSELMNDLRERGAGPRAIIAIGQIGVGL
jgi:hypothetical protein